MLHEDRHSPTEYQSVGLYPPLHLRPTPLEESTMLMTSNPQPLLAEYQPDCTEQQKRGNLQPIRRNWGTAALRQRNHL